APGLLVLLPALPDLLSVRQGVPDGLAPGRAADDAALSVSGRRAGVPPPMWRRSIGLLVVVSGLGACATVPSGPSVMVLPGSGKSFEQFQLDDLSCRQWADRSTGITTSDAAVGSGVATAAIGTAIGAAAGAAIGAAAGNPALGAAAGAGGGLLLGSATG